MIILGCDPGAKGALAFIDSDTDIVALYDMPTCVKAMKQIIESHEPDHCIIEKVGAMTGDGVKSAFTFGYNYAKLCTICELTCNRIYYKRPKTWQSQAGVFKLPAEDIKQAGARILTELDYDPKIFTGPRGGLLDGRVDAINIARSFVLYELSEK